jgi:hypothetical protein
MSANAPAETLLFQLQEQIRRHLEEGAPCQDGLVIIDRYIARSQMMMYQPTGNGNRVRPVVYTHEQFLDMLDGIRRPVSTLQEVYQAAFPVRNDGIVFRYSPEQVDTLVHVLLDRVLRVITRRGYVWLEEARDEQQEGPGLMQDVAMDTSAVVNESQTPQVEETVQQEGPGLMQDMAMDTSAVVNESQTPQIEETVQHEEPVLIPDATIGANVVNAFLTVQANLQAAEIAQMDPTNCKAVIAATDDLLHTLELRQACQTTVDSGFLRSPEDVMLEQDTEAAIKLSLQDSHKRPLVPVPSQDMDAYQDNQDLAEAIALSMGVDVKRRESLYGDQDDKDMAEAIALSMGVELGRQETPYVDQNGQGQKEPPAWSWGRTEQAQFEHDTYLAMMLSKGNNDDEETDMELDALLDSVMPKF